ncbi:protein-glutamine gamma-glutamyltransferase K-like isoform X2 [Genypterus blacodes]|uniref:protein-glutamine gamma-glutamyltransferase K-like isoform X2 n=1 Tax=Genypterus blacodes TaxID=154954 RepID=UPI003F7609D6
MAALAPTPTPAPAHILTGRFPPGRFPSFVSAEAEVPDASMTEVEEEEEDIKEDMLLKVLSIDLMKSQEGQNRTEHHTQLYDGDDLIIRRGQTFMMWLTLSQPFDSSTDKLHLELKTGTLPTVAKKTHVIVPLVKDLQDDRWEAAIVKKDGNRLQLSVNSLSTAVIGRYQLAVETSCPDGEYLSPHDPANDIYMLFNPWCEEDTVFMDSEAERKEYIMNDVGQLYYGTQHQIGARNWDFAQFDEGILAASLFILEISGIPASGCGDPVNVVRVISAMINEQDDAGVIKGNWSGSYWGGTSPTAWTGSLEILKEYMSTKKAVRYGQCWVFSGVTTTVLRCLGIPTRSVTNFNSAHDTDVSLTTDLYFDENMEVLDHLNDDSIWNYHVWNDCWMVRSDLPPGMGGWQAVDSTPQETSQGTFRCGPASLTAIRNGLVYNKYDCQFVFAEVNSDRVFWVRTEDGTFTPFHSEKNTVGHAISTKAVGSEERFDVTHLYKHPEGSEEERIAVETAQRYGSKSEKFSNPAEDTFVEVTMDGDGPQMGGDVQLNIVLKNTSSANRKVALHSRVSIMYYTGVHKATIKKDTTDVELLPNKVKVLEWSLKCDDYKDHLVDQAALLLTLSGRVEETKQIVATQFNFRLRTPDLIIKPIGEAVVGKKMTAEISFTNPLPRVLKAVIFHVEGLGLRAPRKILFGDIGSHASMSLTEELVPTKDGARKLLATLDCEQLTQVHGVAEIIVKKKKK